jgi:acetyl/propionyl-CoA carboxylase alpha subunit
MLGKLIVHAPNRPAALARLARALADYEIAGVETTLPLFRALVADADFQSAAFDVQWLDRRLEDGWLPAEAEKAGDVLIAAVGLAGAEPASSTNGAGAGSVWRSAARRESLRGSL